MNPPSDLESERAATAAMTMMVTLAKSAATARPRIRAGAASKRVSPLPASASLAGKVLGLIGFGEAGRALARRARLGFDMRVLVHDDAAIDPETVDALGIEPASSIDDLLGRADFVSLHGENAAGERPLIDARRLTLMKPDACLINTAHAALIDEQALVHALWFETIGGVGIAVPRSELQRSADILISERAIILSPENDTPPPAPDMSGNVITFLNPAPSATGET